MNHCGKEMQNKEIVMIRKYFYSLFQYTRDSCLASVAPRQHCTGHSVLRRCMWHIGEAVR